MKKGCVKNMRLLIDANILLDVLANRQPYVKESELVWKLCETKQADGSISAITFANLIYVMRKHLDPEKIENMLEAIEMIFRIEDLTANDLRDAAACHWKNYEDAIQSVIASRINAEYIVTRNAKDYQQSSVPALPPREILLRI